jgi:hypothetical protein
LRRRFVHFELGAHFLDLGILLLDLGILLLDLGSLLYNRACESLYLSLLLRDRCFELLNLANFAIERGGAGRHAGCATAGRYATLRRWGNTLGARGNIPAKVVVRKVYSNFNNAADSRLEVIEDTTDVAL